MGTQLDRLAAYASAVADQAPTAPIRIRLSDADALALIAEHGTSTLRNSAKAEEAATALTVALAVPAPAATDIGGLIAWSKVVDKAHSEFWDAIHGELINGVEILRKHS